MTKSNATKKDQLPKLVIMKELDALLNDLRDTEYAELKTAIEADGIRDPLVVWKEKKAILDGHNRYKIAGELGLTSLPIEEKSFKDIGEAEKWMLRNQLGRRNLTPAMFDYYIGKLYNKEKQEEGGKRPEGNTAEKIAEQFGTSERTVRRAGVTASAIDKIEEAKGKVAKKLQLMSGKAEEKYTQKELETVAKASTPAVTKKVLEAIDENKKKIAAAKASVAKPKLSTSSAPKATTYPVAFVQPNFDAIGFDVSRETRPPLDTNAAVYMAVDDGHLDTAISLFRKWGLQYECTFIFKTEPVDGVWSKVQHTFLVVGTRGTITGPDAGKEAMSLPNGPATEPVESKMEKLINSYHPKTDKLAVLSSFKTPQGYSVISKG